MHRTPGTRSNIESRELVDSMRASLICTVYNEEKTIKDFLESIKQQTRIIDEIIIVDGGSTDETVRIIEDYMSEIPIKLMVKECNIAEGRNIAIKMTKYEIIAVTDAGVTLDPKWFEEITKPFKNPQIDVVSGYYIPIIKNRFGKCAARFIYRKPDQITDDFLPSSRSLAFKKNIWSAVGGYPEGLRLAEDTYYDISMKEIGARFEFAPQAVVCWNQGSNLKDFINKRYSYAFWDGIAGITFGKTKLMIRGILLLLLFVASIITKSVWPLSFMILGVILIGILDIRRVADLGFENEHSNSVLDLSLMIILRIINDMVSLTGYANGFIQGHIVPHNKFRKRRV